MNSDELFVAADDLYDAGNYVDAFACFLRNSEAGDSHSMSRLACMYANGEGVVRDIQKSIYWDKKSVSLGNNVSIFNLAVTYRSIGDIRNAKKWFLRAIDEGDGEASLELAKLYMVSDKETETVKMLLGKALQSLNLCEESQEEVSELLKTL